MSQFPESAEAQWISQLTAMRAALADLKLPRCANVLEKACGEVQDFDEDDIVSGDTGDDAWDYISDVEENYSSSEADSVDLPGSGYGSQWLKDKCMILAERRQGLSGEGLQEQIMILLSSNIIEGELQSALTDIIGFDDLDFVIDLISHREELVSLYPFSAKATSSDTGRLYTKEQRETAQRERDFQHKNASLGPKLHRHEHNYPHVYRAHSAGNYLSANGRKYAVPFGTKQKDNEVCILDVNYRCLC